jgi:hypothetical protein
MAEQLGKWSKSQEAVRIPLVANGFLELLSEVCVGWLLLDGAVIASTRAPAGEASDRAFYAGKVAAAEYFASWTLPTVPARATALTTASPVVLELDAEAFG